MAAVTVEDCLKVVPNRFELSLIASYRAKQLMNGSPKLYVSDKVEKNTVIALREIAANLLDIQQIREELQNSIKNQALFKNFDESSIYDSKKDSDSSNISIDENINDGLEDEDLTDDDSIDDEDDDYYDDINGDSIDSDSQDDDFDDK